MQCIVKTYSLWLDCSPIRAGVSVAAHLELIVLVTVKVLCDCIDFILPTSINACLKSIPLVAQIHLPIPAHHHFHQQISSAKLSLLNGLITSSLAMYLYLLPGYM